MPPVVAGYLVSLGSTACMRAEMNSYASPVARGPSICIRWKSQAYLMSVRVVLLAVIGLALLAVPRAVEAEGPASLRRIAFLSSDGQLSPTCTSNRPHVGFRAFLEALRSLGYREGENVAIDCRSAESKYEQLDALAAELDTFLVMHQPFTFDHRERIVNVVARLRLPAMYASREAVELAGLNSYAVSGADTFRRPAFFVDRVLHGAKPADLPVEQPTKFELVVNLKTAKALGLTIPPSLLVRADQVIK